MSDHSSCTCPVCTGLAGWTLNPEWVALEVRDAMRSAYGHGYEAKVYLEAALRENHAAMQCLQQFLDPENRPPLGQDDCHSASPTTVEAPEGVKQSSLSVREPMVAKRRDSDYREISVRDTESMWPEKTSNTTDCVSGNS
jgi:hypothetical protein